LLKSLADGRPPPGRLPRSGRAAVPGPTGRGPALGRCPSPGREPPGLGPGRPATPPGGRGAGRPATGLGEGLGVGLDAGRLIEGLRLTGWGRAPPPCPPLCPPPPPRPPRPPRAQRSPAARKHTSVNATDSRREYRRMKKPLDESVYS
jgi:hypothetical protein